jgi:glycosyltransferase involved in cell wall biosynthesis
VNAPGPTVSIIIPAYNAEHLLPLCLDGIAASTRPPDELIVVDDRSTDGTVRIAEERGARVLRMEKNSGPGGARNMAVQEAIGDVVLFVDADVVVHPDTVEVVARTFREHPDVAATFGSYDDNPAERNFLSQYKNLHHAYVHQQSNDNAATFWAGCGAIRRSVFLEMGGFDLEKYPVPSIEDIELGYRMRARGHRIRLEKDIQVQHLKKWTLRNLLWTDIFCRAIPWTNLILETKTMEADLNLKISDRISTGLLGLALLMLPLAVLWPAVLLGSLVCLVGILILNRDLYLFFLRHRGVLFMLRAIPVHLMYYLYSGGAFVTCWLRHRLAPAR